MTTGAYISGVGHVAFLLFLLIGGIFDRSDLPEVSVADVSVISEEEFAALTRPETAPDVDTDAVAPEAPQPEEAAPEISTGTEAAPEVPDAALQPQAAETDSPAEPLESPIPVPNAEVSDALPPVEAPLVPDDRPEAPEEAAPAPALRVAPDPAAPAPPLAESAPEMIEETAPLPEPKQPQPEQTAAAPPEATTEIVTEAERTTSLAPAASPRPRSRPSRPAPSKTADADPEPTTDAVADALAAAVAGGSEKSSTAAPSGPPLTGGERDVFRIAVQNCWVVDVGSQAANVTVTVSVSMSRDGTVVGGEVRFLSATGGDEGAQRTAYEAARRAVLRCQKGGYPLPVEKYDRWRDIEMTFNPEGMRLK